MIARKLKESMLQYETINDRICKLRMKRRYKKNITIISLRAPTEEKEERKKEEFYECS
jgi:hypothetical protein